MKTETLMAKILKVGTGWIYGAMQGGARHDTGMNFRESVNSRAYAEEMVRRWNVHDEMLAVLKVVYETENGRDDFAPEWMGQLREVIEKSEKGA